MGNAVQTEALLPPQTGFTGLESRLRNPEFSGKSGYGTRRFSRRKQSGSPLAPDPRQCEPFADPLPFPRKDRAGNTDSESGRSLPFRLPDPEKRGSGLVLGDSGTGNNPRRGRTRLHHQAASGKDAARKTLQGRVPDPDARRIQPSGHGLRRHARIRGTPGERKRRFPFD